MNEKLTMNQLNIIKQMTELTEAFANQMYHIMENHGLDKIEGCNLQVTVRPELKLTTKNITLGCPDTDFGFCNLSMGREEQKYTTYGKNSPVYELLFCDPAVREQMEKIVTWKPLPPDGMWVGDDYKGEW